MKDNMKKVQVYFTNKFAAHMYSHSDYMVYSDPKHPEMYQVRMLDEVLVKGLFSKMERFFYQKMMESLALDAQEAIDEEMDRVGFIDDSDNTDRFLDSLAESLLEKIDKDFDNTDFEWLIYEMKRLMAKKYSNVGERDEAANYSGFFYKSDERFETVEEFLIAFGLIDDVDTKKAKEEAAKRARMLDMMDSFVRNNIQDEEIFQGWLLVVPDDADLDDYYDMGADEQCFIEVCELFISLMVQENAMNIKRSLYCDMLQEFICKAMKTGGRR